MMVMLSFVMKNGPTTMSGVVICNVGMYIVTKRLNGLKYRLPQRRQLLIY